MGLAAEQLLRGGPWGLTRRRRAGGSLRSPDHGLIGSELRFFDPSPSPGRGFRPCNEAIVYPAANWAGTVTPTTSRAQAVRRRVRRAIRRHGHGGTRLPQDESAAPLTLAPRRGGSRSPRAGG